MPMTVPHEHTETEQQIWDHMQAGEWDAIVVLQQQATDREQFEVDYRNATAHYQDAHETSEAERIAATVEEVQNENLAASESGA
jgi:phytoene dehydrogenase-like protein